MLEPDIKETEATWTTQDGRVIPISKLEDQHLCNCYWFSKILWGEPHHKIIAEVTKRFKDKPLPFKPLPVRGEIEWLKSDGLIHGTDIVWKGEVIGSIKHLDL